MSASRAAFEPTALARAEHLYKLLQAKLDEVVQNGGSTMEVSRLVKTLLFVLEFQRGLLFPRQAVPQVHLHAPAPEHFFQTSVLPKSSPDLIELDHLAKKALNSDQSDSVVDAEQDR